MVVNAPQSNILSAAEHTIALLLAQARNVPQANADLRGRPLEPLEVGRRRAARQDARHRRARPRRRARRAARARVRDAARRVRPVRERRPGAPARRAARADDRGAGRDLRLRDDPRRPRRPTRSASSNAEVLAKAKPGMRLINAGRGGIVDEEALADAIRRRASRRRRDRHVRGGAHHRVAAVRARQRRGHAAPRRVDRRSAGQGGRDDRRAGRARVARRLRAVRRERRRVRGVRDACGRSCRWPSGSAGCSPGSPGGAPDTLEIFYEGEIADYDCRVLTLSILKGVLGPVVDEPVSFVNAPQLAEERGIAVRETKSSDARDYVNLIVVRGDEGDGRAGRGHAVRQAAGARASSASTSTPSTCRPRATCSSCTTTTRPA